RVSVDTKQIGVRVLNALCEHLLPLGIIKERVIASCRLSRFIYEFKRLEQGNKKPIVRAREAQLFYEAKRDFVWCLGVPERLQKLRKILYRHQIHWLHRHVKHLPPFDYS